MSRSSFYERFTALVGRSPLRYHNEWRLTLARDMLEKLEDILQLLAGEVNEFRAVEIAL